MRPALAARVTEWFTRAPTGPTPSVVRSYRALERETARRFEIVRRRPDVRVTYVRTECDTYSDASALRADVPPPELLAVA
jgi:hypothetical protein